MRMPHATFLNNGVIAAALAALIRSQMPAAGATALFRNHDVFAKNLTRPTNRMLVATIYSLDDAVDDDFVRFFERKVAPALHRASVNPTACFRTEESPNNFVWFAWFDDEHAYRKSAAALDASPNWRDWISVDLRHRLKSDPLTLRLAPTLRPLLR